MLGTTVDRAFVGESEANSIAAKAGFEIQDEVIRVADAEVRSWNEFRLEVLNQGLDGGDLPVVVQDAEGNEQLRNLALGDIHLLEDEGDIFKHLGFNKWWPNHSI